MGYRYSQRDAQKFFIAAEHHAAIIVACEKYIAESITNYPPNKESWDFYTAMSPANALETMEMHTSWHLIHDSENNVVAFNWTANLKDYHDEFFTILAPFVKEGSYVELEGDEDDDVFRIVWDGKTWDKVFATISF